MGIIPLFDWGEANALFYGKIYFKSINQDRGLKLFFQKVTNYVLIFSFNIKYPKQKRENAYLTKSNFYAIRINHFFLFLI